MLWLLLACNAPLDPAGQGIIEPIPGTDLDDSGGGDSGVDSGDSGDTGSSDPIEPVEEAPRVLINEAMSANQCSFGVDGAMPDWIELYNDSPTSLTMDRVMLWDADGTMWIGPAAVELPPGGYFLVYADGGATGAHAPFHLSKDGDSLTLLVDGQTTDRLALGMLPDDTAWARFPDGGEWGLTMGGTPGGTNDGGPTVFEDETSNLFNLDSLRVVDINLDEADERSLTSSPQTYVETAVAFNGVAYDPVGVRLRGSMTFQPLTGKPAFKIDMNRYADSTYCGEMKKFNVLNMYYDASLVREYMAYYIFREFGVPAARNAYTQTNVAGTYIGIELLSEAYDDVFLDNWYGYDGGVDYMIWEESGLECEEGACDNSIVTNCINIFNNQSASEENYASLQTCMDTDAVLREIAGELTLGQWDGYCAPHNYRWAYNPVTGLLQLIPSSLDLTFDNLGYSYGGDYFQCNGSQLLRWCLQVDSCESQYIDILNELADRIEGGGEGDMQVDATMDQIYDLIEPHVADEPRGQYNYSQWETNFTYVREYLHTLPDEIRSQIASH